MYKINLILIGIIFSVLVLPGQSISQSDEILSEELSTVFNTSGTIATKSSTKNVGSPYLNEDFLKGHIILNNNAKTNALMLRYNIEENHLEFIRNGEVLIAEINQLKAFKIYASPDDIVFRRGYNTRVDRLDEKTFLRSVYNGKVSLLAHHIVNLIEDVPTYSSATTKNKYNRSVVYYLVTNDGKFKKIKNPEKDVLRLLSNKKEALTTYVDSEKLDLNKESELAKLLKYYDSLN